MKKRTAAEEEDLMALCGNSMPFLLTPDELTRFAEAEEEEKRVAQEEASLIDLLRARKPIDYKEPELSPKWEEILTMFSNPDLREVCLFMRREELDLYRSLRERGHCAAQTLYDLSRLAADRRREMDK